MSEPYPVYNEHRASKALPYLLAVYVSGLLLANATGAKLMQLGPLVLSVGALAYPLTYVLQDVINELYGKQKAKVAVRAAFCALIALASWGWVSTMIPDAFSPKTTEAFDLVFGTAPRIVLASLCAFFIGGLIDVHVFFKFRERWRNGLLARKVCSTLVSQLIDTIIFVSIGFVGVLPTDQIIPMIVGQYIAKQVMAVGGLPITYTILGVVGREKA